MPTTTRQLAKLTGISESTVRNYTRDYAELLSPQGRGDLGPRLFSDADVQILRTVAALRKEDVPRAEIIERLQSGDIFIDTAPSPQQAATNGPQAPQLPTIAQYSPQAFVEALERHHARHSERVYWSHVRAFMAGVVTMAFAFYLAWLLVNGL